MMRRIHKGLRWQPCAVAAALSFGSGRVVAQPAEPGAGPKAEVSDVMDVRQSVDEYSSLTIQLRLSGVSPEDVERLRIHVHTATDSQGGNLRPIESRVGPEYNGLNWDEPEIYDGAISVAAKTKSPARQALKIARLQGEIELLLPARDPDALIVLDNWSKNLGQPLEQAALRANGITLRVLSRAQYGALPEAQRDKGVQEVIGADVMFLLSDPQHRLAVAQFESPDGTDIRPIDFSFSADGLLAGFEPPLPIEARLKLLIATPKASVVVPFSFSDIALP